MTNAVGNTSPSSQQTIYVTVNDTNSGDAETIALVVETGNNAGVLQGIRAS